MTGQLIRRADRSVLGQLLDGFLALRDRFIKPEAAEFREHPADTGALFGEHVLSSAHEGGLLLLHVASGRLFACNSTGARIWLAATGGVGLKAIAEEISKERSVEREVVHQHALSFVAELEMQGLITRRERP
jgi:hypothetical protein